MLAEQQQNQNPNLSQQPSPSTNSGGNSTQFSPLSAGHQSSTSSLNGDQPQDKYRTPNIKRKLPALARVIKCRVPNAYDNTALKLQVRRFRLFFL